MSLTSRDRRKFEEAIRKDPLTAFLTFTPLRKLKPAEFDDNGIPRDDDLYDEFGDPMVTENAN